MQDVMLPTGPLVLQSSPIRIIQHILQARSIAPICHFYLERFEQWICSDIFATVLTLSQYISAHT